MRTGCYIAKKEIVPVCLEDVSKLRHNHSVIHQTITQGNFGKVSEVKDFLNPLKKGNVILEDITVDPVAMQTLQQEMPVLFELLRLLKYVPTKVLSPLIAALIEKSVALFSSGRDHSVPCVNASKMEPLSFLLQLLSIQSRGTYAVDRTNTTPKICTKRSTGHPTLLPGIFTLFCQHG